MFYQLSAARRSHIRVVSVSPTSKPVPSTVKRAVKCMSAASTEGGVGKLEVGDVDITSLPVVRGWPLIGMSKYLFDNDLDLSKLHKELGATFVIDLGFLMGGKHLAVSDVDSVRDVLSGDHTRFRSSWPDEYTTLFSVWGRAGSPEEMLPWKRNLLRILSKENVLSLQLPLMVEDMTKRIRMHAASGKQILWQYEGRRIAFGVAARASMGNLVTDGELDTYFQLFNKVSIFGDSNFGLKEGLPGTRFYKAMQARKQIEALLSVTIKAALEDPALLEGETSAVTRILQTLQEDDSEYSPKDIDEMTAYIAKNTYFLMFAGTDTTSNLLLRIAIVLTRHPEWFQKLQEEQDRLRQEFGDTLDRKVLSRSAVANAIAQELLRVKVPVRSAFRTAQRDQTVNGMRIPDGTRIVASLQIPTKATGTADFNPAQWLDATGTAAVPNDGPGNLAWGGGPRRCAGQNLATVELITSLAILGREVQRFEIPPEKNDHDYFSTQTHPTGCPATIIPRS